MIFKRRRNSNDKMLDANIADQMLQNVFDVCEVELNTVPLEVLESYSKYRRDRFFFQKLVIIIMMLLFLAIPLLFLGPSMKIHDQTEASHPAYVAQVDSVLPITSVIATIDGKRMPVYETKPHVYSIEPTISGKMTVTVTALNKQYACEVFDAKCMDRETPVIVSDEVKGNKLYLYVSDDTGIAFSKIYAEDVDGNKSYPSSYDEKTGLIIYDYPSKNTNVFIPDISGNTLHLILTVN